MVEPPEGGYEYNEEYTLYMTKDILNEKGAGLSKPILMKFKIEKYDPNA